MTTTQPKGNIMKTLLLSLAIFAAAAQAQTTITVVSQTCNVANTACVLQGDGGQVITLDPTSVKMSIDDVGYLGAVTSSVVLTSTLYRHTSDVTFTFTPTAQVDAIYTLARGGSGRGGWAWHPHWQFLTITVY